MRGAIEKLLSTATEPISSLAISDAAEFLGGWGSLGAELGALLTLRNGFYAYESALLVRAFRHVGFPFGLLEWNAPELWRRCYSGDLCGALFFGEDVFGTQFAIRAEAVCSFDPETEQFETLAGSLGEWAEGLIADYEFRTGYPLAHEWQVANAPLRPGMRLLPKTPFVCGGAYELGNLYALDDVAGMRFRASIANQIRDVRDGSEITIERSPPIAP